MATPTPPDDEPGSTWEQSFETDKSPAEVLDAAEVYLDGAGVVSPGLQGRLEREGDVLVVHHGRIKTQIVAHGSKRGVTQVDIHRRGRAPLEGTRLWLYTMGMAGTILAWVLAYYNDRNEAPLPPLASITIFFLGIMAAISVLYVVDRSLERRSQSLVLALEEAVRGDPFRVLQKEVDGLEKSSSLVNGVLFYAVSILIEFIIFMVLLSNGIREGIDEAVTVDVMRVAFLIPVAPAVLFGLFYFLFTNRLHRDRLATVERRFQDLVVPAKAKSKRSGGRPKAPGARGGS